MTEPRRRLIYRELLFGEFEQAVNDAYLHKTAALCAYLRSDKPLDDEGANKSWCSPTGARPVRVRP